MCKERPEFEIKSYRGACDTIQEAIENIFDFSVRLLEYPMNVIREKK
jgi:hypothetical protein